MIPTIVVAGDICLDSYIFCSVDRLNPEAPIPLLNRERSVKSLGMGGLVANMVKALGATPRLVCLGDHICVFMDAAGLSTEYVVPWQGRMIRKTRYMASAAGRPHQPVLRVDDEVIDPIDDETRTSVIMACERAMDGADAVVLSDYGKGILHESVISNVMRMASLRKIPVLVDPARNLDSWRRYEGAMVIKANRHEAGAAGFGWHKGAPEDTGMPAAYIGEWFSDYVVVTLDGEGYVLADRYRCAEIHHPAAPVHTVADVVGCGDQYLATMAVAIANGATVASACRLGNLAAGIQVGRSGCDPVTRCELQTALRSEDRIWI